LQDLVAGVDQPEAERPPFEQIGDAERGGDPAQPRGQAVERAGLYVGDAVDEDREDVGGDQVQEERAPEDDRRIARFELVLALPGQRHPGLAEQDRIPKAAQHEGRQGRQRDREIIDVRHVRHVFLPFVIPAKAGIPLPSEGRFQLSLE